MIKRILLLTLLLISPLSFADWGEEDYILEKFKFKLDKAQNAMKFGKSGYFKDYSISLDRFAPSYQSWAGGNDYAKARFDAGKFLFSSVHSDNVTTITANCDKF
jgi:hypothetical protein